MKQTWGQGFAGEELAGSLNNQAYKVHIYSFKKKKNRKKEKKEGVHMAGPNTCLKEKG